MASPTRQQNNFTLSVCLGIIGQHYATEIKSKSQQLSLFADLMEILAVLNLCKLLVINGASFRTRTGNLLITNHKISVETVICPACKTVE